MERQVDRQVDRQTDRQTDLHAFMFHASGRNVENSCEWLPETVQSRVPSAQIFFNLKFYRVGQPYFCNSDFHLLQVYNKVVIIDITFYNDTWIIKYVSQMDIHVWEEQALL